MAQYWFVVLLFFTFQANYSKETAILQNMDSLTEASYARMLARQSRAKNAYAIAEKEKQYQAPKPKIMKQQKRYWLFIVLIGAVILVLYFRRSRIQ